MEIVPETEILPSGAVRQKVAGRGMFQLLSPWAIERDAKLFEWGANHRGYRNWEMGVPFERCIRSIWSHLLQYMKREEDPEHGDCLAAIRFWCLALMHQEEMIRRGVLPKELDDRPRYDPLDGEMRIYVAGPISADTEDELERNFKVGQDIGTALQDLGHLVFVPHNYMIKEPGSGRLPKSIYEGIMQLDLDILSRWANAIYFIAPSPGANRELELAKSLGLRVFRSLEEVPNVTGARTRTS